MENNKFSIPKPPKSLRKEQPKTEPEKLEEQEEPSLVQEQPVLEEEQFDAQQIDQQPTSVPKKERKKLNFEPATNWIGLFVSLAIFGVFIFLLVIN